MAAAKQAPARNQDALEIVRHYDAPCERVWQAWTDPQALSGWFGPGPDSRVTQVELDARPGGSYTIAFRTPDGEEHRVFGVYEEVTALRVLSFSWAWQSTPDRVSFVRIELQREGSGTRMSFRHDIFHDAAALENHERGWAAALAKLGEWLKV